MTARSDAHRPSRRLSNIDLGFALLRGLLLLGGAAWLVLTPSFPQNARLQFWLLLAFFAGYSALLHGLVFVWPDAVRKLYLVALVLDLAAVYRLLSLTGGIESSFTVALYLLVALHSFYYGLALGLAVATAAAVLSYFSDLPASAQMHFPDLVVRLSFLFFVAVSIGLLREKERRDRSQIDKLNRDLDSQTDILRKANERLTRMHERLLHSERLAIIGKMSAQIAHEIRNPLSSMSLDAELLGDEIDSVESIDLSQARSLLASMQEQVDILTHVIEDYLQFARIPEIRPEKVSLNALISGIIESMGPEFRQNAAEVLPRLSRQMPEISLDSYQFRIALVNILRNSLEAMPKGGRIVVSTELRNGRVAVSLTDSGVGIHPDNIDKIFTPFFTTKDNGTGLGLSLAQQIIEKHGGDISCRSNTGEGTSFIIDLPLDARREEELV
jgi:signal transduction histidine kinase